MTDSEKPRLVVHLARLIRRHRLDHSQFEAARKETGLRRPARSRRLPRVLPEQTLRRYYEAVDQDGSLQHQIMLRLRGPTPPGRVQQIVQKYAEKPGITEHVHTHLSGISC